VSLRLDDLRAPPPTARFHSELRRRTEAADRAGRRRYRIAAGVALAAALVVASAAGVSAFRDAGAQLKPVDATFTCTVPNTGGVNRVDVITRVRGPASNYGGVRLPNPAEALFGTADNGPNVTDLVAAREVANGYSANDALCRRASRPIPLARSGLPAAGVVRGTRGDTIQRECWLASTVAIRIHVVYGKGGKPEAAQLALRTGKKLRAAAFIDWTPTRAAVFASSSCNQS
jgi:hypothetical protein